MHLGDWAINRAGLITTDASAVSPVVPISVDDARLGNSEPVETWRPVTAFFNSKGVLLCVHLARGGRKASSSVRFKPGGSAPAAEERGMANPGAVR